LLILTGHTGLVPRVPGWAHLRVSFLPGWAHLGDALLRGDQHAVVLAVPLAGDGAGPFPRPVRTQRHSGHTHPADAPGRYSGHQCVVRYVLGHHGSGSHARPRADAHRRHTHRPSADRRTPADLHAHRGPVVSRFTGTVGIDRPRILVIGQHHRGADEDSLVQ